jgi:hypothetical protein
MCIALLQELECQLPRIACNFYGEIEILVVIIASPFTSGQIATQESTAPDRTW